MCKSYDHMWHISTTGSSATEYLFSQTVHTLVPLPCSCMMWCCCKNQKVNIWWVVKRCDLWSIAL